MIFKVSAQGDTIYIRAASEADVANVMKRHFGFIPGSAYDAEPFEERYVPKHEEILE